MGLELEAPSRADIEQVRLWRNDSLQSLRTPYPLTEETQADFYEDVICNRQSDSRWWSVFSGGILVGLVGLVGIEWENGLAEISYITKTGYKHDSEIAGRLLSEGFDNMGLSTIYGECYQCNPAVEFWKKVTQEHGGYYTMIPRRKRWQGQLYDALHFSVWR